VFCCSAASRWLACSRERLYADGDAWQCYQQWWCRFLGLTQYSSFLKRTRNIGSAFIRGWSERLIECSWVRSKLLEVIKGWERGAHPPSLTLGYLLALLRELLHIYEPQKLLKRSRYRERTDYVFWYKWEIFYGPPRHEEFVSRMPSYGTEFFKTRHFFGNLNLVFLV